MLGPNPAIMGSKSNNYPDWNPASFLMMRGSEWGPLNGGQIALLNFARAAAFEIGEGRTMWPEILLRGRLFCPEGSRLAQQGKIIVTRPVWGRDNRGTVLIDACLSSSVWQKHLRSCVGHISHELHYRWSVFQLFFCCFIDKLSTESDIELMS